MIKKTLFGVFNENTNEKWHVIKNYPNYLISSFGRIINVINMKIKELKTHKNGYVNCTIKNAKGKKKFRVHRLVADAFLSKKDNYNIVNHLDGIKNNNKVENLEWTNTSGNIQHAYNTGLIKKNKNKSRPGKGVEQYSANGELIRIYKSIKQASNELNISTTRIIVACKNGVNTTNFIFKYADDMQIDGEIWKNINIKWFESYKISNKGRLMNNNGLIIKPTLKDGYCLASLHNKNHNKHMFIHQLVGLMFIQNPNNFPMINHINGIKNDNRVENLEWINNSGNIKHAYETGLFVPHMRKIVQLTTDNKLVKIYESMTETQKEGYVISAICRVCKGKKPQYKGYLWKYYEDYVLQIKNEI